MSNFLEWAPLNLGKPKSAPQAYMASTADALATITTAGYLDDKSDMIKEFDIIFVNYLVGGVEVATSGYVDVAASVYSFVEGLPGSGSGADEVTSVFTRTGAVVAVAGDYTAAEITNVPAGGVVATDAQAAITELDTKKAPLASPTFTGTVTVSNLAATEGAGGISGEATLAVGTVSVATTAVAANSRIQITRSDLNASPALGFLTVGTITPGTGFVVSSLDATAGAVATDVSKFSWLITNPAA